MRRSVCEILEQRRMLTASTIFGENFDDRPLPDGWQIAAAAGSSVDWAGEESGFGGVTAHSGQFMIYAAALIHGTTPQNPTVPSGTNVVLYRTIDLTDYTNAFVSFWYNIPSLDTGQLRVNANDGNFNDSTALFSATTITDGWTEGYANLSAFAGQQKTLEFYYTGSGGEGAFLDDITIYADTPTESILPTAKMLANPADVASASGAPVTFQVEYDDNTGIDPGSVGNTNIAVLLNGSSAGDAQLQSMLINSNGSINATYSYLPSDGQWDGLDQGTYTLQLQSSSIFDTSGNTAAQTLLSSFNCTIPEPLDTNAYFTGSDSGITVLPGDALPTIPIELSVAGGSIPNGAVHYTADIYLTSGPYVDAADPGQLIGQIPFSTTLANQVDLDPTSAGLIIPTDMPPGTYSLVAHVNSPANYPDSNDSNNWALGETVTVQVPLNNPTIVTVMVLYTPGTDQALGGDAAMQQQINTAIATTNAAFANSDVDVQLQLAYAGEVNYSETDPVTDLTNLSSAAGGLNQVPMLRDLYAADLVSLWTASSTTEDIGEAYIGGGAADQNLGYSVVVATQMDAYTFAHEIGHNFGAGHAAGDSSGENSGNGLYDYSHGYRFTVPGYNEYHDIMSYPPGTTIPYYSNPNIDYLGSPTGTVDANNALTISEDAANVAAYRSPVVPVISAEVAANASESGHAGDFRITASILAVVEWPVTVNVSLTYAGSPSQSDYQTPADSVSITIPAGSTNGSSDVTVTALDDSVYESDETLVMTIKGGDGYAVGQGTAEMTIADATAPSIASIAPSAASVKLKGTYKITATGVSPGAGSPIVSVTFYRDSTHTGIFSSSDAVIGTDKKAGGGWKISGKAKSLNVGNNAIFAVAKDAGGLSSVAVSCMLDVVDQPPVVKKFTAKVYRNGLAEGEALISASAKDSDGKVSRLTVWVDSNGNDVPDSTEQSFNGTNSMKQVFTVVPNQSYTLLAIAYDNDGVASVVKQLTFGG